MIPFPVFSPATAVSPGKWSSTDKSSRITLSNDDHDAIQGTSGVAGTAVRSATTIANNTGKFITCIEMSGGSGGDGVLSCGVSDAANSFIVLTGQPDVQADMYMYRDEGRSQNNGAAVNTGLTNWAPNSAPVNVMIAIDTASGAGKIWMGINGVWETSGDPAAGTGALFTGISNISTWAFYANNDNSSGLMSAKFKAYPYTIPSGFTEVTG